MQDKAPRRKAVNVTVDAALLGEAKAAGINLSATLEVSLRLELKARRAARWRAENAEALSAYDRHIEQDGLWLDDQRTW